MLGLNHIDSEYHTSTVWLALLLDMQVVIYLLKGFESWTSRNLELAKIKELDYLSWDAIVVAFQWFMNSHRYQFQNRLTYKFIQIIIFILDIIPRNTI